jgi:cytochrome P450
VFANPSVLDIERNPNRHVSFGGGGIHHCIGSGIARVTLRSIFRELLGRLPDIEVNEPQYLTSCEVQGITHMNCAFTVP